MLVTVNLYLEAVSRVEPHRRGAARSWTPPTCCYRQATNLKDSGLVAGHRRGPRPGAGAAAAAAPIVAENEFEKASCGWAAPSACRPGSRRLTDTIPFAPLDAGGAREGARDAYAHRADYLAARDRVAAAEARAKAAVSAEHLPSVTLDADYGTIGQTRVERAPDLQRGRHRARADLRGRARQGTHIEADAMLRQRRAEYDDLRGRIDTEVRSAYLDVTPPRSRWTPRRRR